MQSEVGQRIKNVFGSNTGNLRIKIQPSEYRIRLLVRGRESKQEGCTWTKQTKGLNAYCGTVVDFFFHSLTNIIQLFLGYFFHWTDDMGKSQSTSALSSGGVPFILNPEENGSVGLRQIIEEFHKVLQYLCRDATALPRIILLHQDGLLVSAQLSI